MFQRLRSFRWPLVTPLLAPIVVAALSAPFYLNRTAQHLADNAEFFQAKSYTFGAEPATFLGYTLWMVSEYLFLTLNLMCLIASVTILWPLVGRERRRWLAVGLGCTGAAIAILQVQRVEPVLTPAYTRRLSSLVAEYIDATAPRFLNLSTPLMVCVLVLGALATCLLCGGTSSPTELAQRHARLRLLLFGFSSLMAIGVLEVYAFHRIPIGLLHDDAQKHAMAQTAASIAMMGGTLHSMLLVALFAPAAWQLGDAAQRAASREHPEDVAAQDEWLAKRGLSRSFVSDARTLISYASPFLTSVAGYLWGATHG